MKGLFIPGITAEMFRNGCLESIEALMAEGEIYDIEHEPKQQWIPVSEGLPEGMSGKEAATLIEEIGDILKQMRTAESILQLNEIQCLANRRIFELWTMRCEELKRGRNERPEND